MKIIVPMAGEGSRLRPHTLTIPKSLIPIAGKPIVQRLMEKIIDNSEEIVDEIAYITGFFGKEVEYNLIEITKKLGVKGTIYYQTKALGTAHAIYCAKDKLKGKIVIAFADTLFISNDKINKDSDGVVWVKKVIDPTGFGVVKLNYSGNISNFLEKPDHYVSNLAIIGIYYFKSGEKLLEEIEFLLKNNILDKGEFQLTSVIDNMVKKGVKITLIEVADWMDCGNKKVTVESNSKILDYESHLYTIPENAIISNSLVIPPCYIGQNSIIVNSKIGPNVSIGEYTEIKESNISYSLIQKNCKIHNANIHNSMIGNYVEYFGISRDLSLGDYSILDFKK